MSGLNKLSIAEEIRPEMKAFLLKHDVEHKEIGFLIGIVVKAYTRLSNQAFRHIKKIKSQNNELKEAFRNLSDDELYKAFFPNAVPSKNKALRIQHIKEKIQLEQ